jgi:hypothetical protein
VRDAPRLGFTLVASNPTAAPRAGEAVSVGGDRSRAVLAIVAARWPRPCSTGKASSFRHFSAGLPAWTRAAASLCSRYVLPRPPFVRRQRD